MKKYISLLQSSYLFQHCNEDEIHNIIQCLEVYNKTFHKNKIIYNIYEQINYAGIVLNGEVNSIMINATDNVLVMQQFKKGSLFAGAYACIPTEPSNMQIIAQTDCVFFF